jgi:hypothetical protein
MQLKYRLFQRAGGAFYWQENGAANRGSFRTKDRAEAKRLLLTWNEAHQQPTLNLAPGLPCPSAHDPRLCTRTWQSSWMKRPGTANPRRSSDAPEPCAAEHSIRPETSHARKPARMNFTHKSM